MIAHRDPPRCSNCPPPLPWSAPWPAAEVRDDNFLVRGWVHREEWGDTVSTWSRYVSSYVYTLSDFVPEIAYTETEKLTSLLLHLMYETFFGFLGAGTHNMDLPPSKTALITSDCDKHALPEPQMALTTPDCAPLVGTMATLVMAGQASAQKKDEKIQAVREITTTAGVPLRKKKIIRGFYDTMCAILDRPRALPRLRHQGRLGADARRVSRATFITIRGD